MRSKMGETAVRVAKAAGYANAGTVEFLVDAKKNFYFLEMNTRLQVEHPVTELVTGVDLVHMQIQAASGMKLGMKQEDVQVRGHAIECRIYAEDPDNNFFPSPGKITQLAVPAGPGIREDSGVYEGWTVPLDYDPMLSKLIAYAPTRDQAIARALRALDEYFIGGIKNNISLFRRILRDKNFVAGKMDTGFLDRMLAEPTGKKSTGTAKIAAIAAAVFELSRSGGSANTLPMAAAERKNGSGDGAKASHESGWKRTARREAIRHL
jgi:acetyl-CoA carboxylase biotin carboxylase subunit